MPVTRTKETNGSDTMSEPTKEQKLMEFDKQAKIIERKLKDERSRAEAKLLLHTLIFHFDGFARQQQLVNRYMSSEYHWGNKRTARVLRTLSEIGVIDRSKSESDNWTLFFVVKGFLEECGERIKRAALAIKLRLGCYRSAIFSLTRIKDASSGT